MFEHPELKGADAYMVEVALDSTDPIFKHPVAVQKDSSTAILISGFDFGKKYIWRYCGLQNGKQLAWNGPYKFETLVNPFVDKDLFRVRVLRNDTQVNNGGLIVLDMSGNVVDRNGKFVWFFPWGANVPAKSFAESFVNIQNRDMRFTSTGTITSITDKQAQERDLNGNIIWQAPQRNNPREDSLNGGSVNNYHHCFKKLNNGNYMVLDMEYFALPDSQVALRRPPYKGVAKAGDNKLVVAYEVIREFDRSSNLVWSWRAKNYLDTVPEIGMKPGQPDSAWLNHNPLGHINAFDVDEKNGFVYAGFRDLNRVVKIDKATGAVVCAWGDGMKYHGAPNGEGFFLKQHGTTLLRNGDIAVYNNNPKPVIAGAERPVSEVVIFTEPRKGAASQFAWKFDCKLDSADNLGKAYGNVDELNNGNLLVDMGSVNRIFEITRSKQIVWNAVAEVREATNVPWQKFAEYRSHYTSSLYPCYFTAQTRHKVINDSLTTYRLKVFNDGSEPDSYNIEISSSSGRYNNQFTTAVFTAKTSVSFDIAPALLTTCNEKIEATITSKANPAFVRVVCIK